MSEETVNDKARDDLRRVFNEVAVDPVVDRLDGKIKAATERIIAEAGRRSEDAADNVVRAIGDQLEADRQAEAARNDDLKQGIRDIDARVESLAGIPEAVRGVGDGIARVKEMLTGIASGQTAVGDRIEARVSQPAATLMEQGERLASAVKGLEDGAASLREQSNEVMKAAGSVRDACGDVGMKTADLSATVVAQAASIRSLRHYVVLQILLMIGLAVVVWLRRS